MIKKIFLQRSSANIKENASLNIKNVKTIGIAKTSVENNPAEITLSTFNGLFSALYLDINLETVIGVPEAQTVNKSPKTERATWYIPIPSDPIVLDIKIRYKKPKIFSETENTVTTATVLKKPFKSYLLIIIYLLKVYSIELINIISI